MAVEVADSNFAIIENGTEANGLMDSEKVNITFGSHGVDEPVKVEATNVSDSNLPKDVVDEWPEPKQIHSFYIVRYRALEDHSVKAKLDVAEKERQKKTQARLQTLDKLRAKRADRAQVIAQLVALGVENKQIRSIMDEKRKEIEPLRQALGMLKGSGGGERGSAGICSSEEELNAYIKSLQYRIQHESIPLTEEKQILREIKMYEGTRQKVIAFAAERARIQDSMGEKDAIQGQVKLIGNDLDSVKKDRQTINNKRKQLEEEKFAVDKVIGVLEAELNEATEKLDKAFDTIRDMRKQREDGNSPFYQNRILLTKAKDLAAKKDVDSLKELSETEADKFMALWNSNKAFRDDYQKRILSSLDTRQLTRDGRLRNPNEKPIVRIEAPTTTITTTDVVVKKSEKQIPKVEDVVVPAKDDVSKTKVGKNNNNEGNNKKTVKTSDEADEEEYFQTEKSKEALLPKKVEVDEKKLKELRREEEIAKRAQAEERKKKRAEKAAAKAAIKAQKEAEKKLKDREKKAKKKAGGAADSEEATEATEEEVAEVEKVEEKIETIPQKNKDRNTVRQRGGRPRGGGPDSFPKAILKRKKATNYWVWAAAPAAALAFVLLVLVGYNYLS